jgi:Domain of unknown function (DUF4249)
MYGVKKRTFAIIKISQNHPNIVYMPLFSIKNIVFLILLATLIGCISEIDFAPKEPDTTSLAINGQFTNSKGEQMLRLTRPGYYKFGASFEPVIGATVMIVDEKGNKEQYRGDLEEKGLYLLPGRKVRGQPGGTYYIEIALTDGKTYRSEPETMPQSVKSDSISVKPEIEETISKEGVVLNSTRWAAVSVHTKFPTTNKTDVYLRWHAENVYMFIELAKYWLPLKPAPKSCFIKDYFNFQNVALLQSKGLERGVPLSRRIARKIYDESFEVKVAFNVYQYSITPKAYTFWSEAQKVTEQVGSIFDAPPATVKGNVYNTKDKNDAVLGYFEVSAVDTLRKFVGKGELKDPTSNGSWFLPPRCNYTVGRQFPPVNKNECIDCITIPNSSYVVPYYWQ